ncbi:MAG: Hsp70 family protein [Candidatus Binatia bacterium]
MGNGKIVGIDLGTTNSAVAVWDNKGPRLIPSVDGSRLTPSVVGFAANGDVQVGEIARHNAVANAGSTIYSAKRFIGRPFDAVAADRADVSYEVVEGEHGEAEFVVEDKLWSPEEISALILGELKKSAEAFLDGPIDGAVITAPAHFNDAQRAATRKAASLAGINVHRILNEPTAAALAYGLDKMVEGERIVAVYDFGGGTFDVSILSVGEDIIEVIATRGDPHLGGDMIDTRIAAWLLDQYAEQAGAPADEDAATLQRLREAAENAKISLSASEVVVVTLALPGDARLEASISRAAFDEMIGDLVDRTLASCSQVLADAGKQRDQIDEVVLAGGSTRIPLVRERVSEYFGRQPLCTLDPDEIVAMGAAVQAGILAGELKGVVLVDVTSLSLGIETHEGRTAVVTPRNTTLPVAATRIFTTSRDDQTAVQFHVVQGESESAKENASLGRFVLDGLDPAKAGSPQIEVTFTIDINGMVLVSARDRNTGNEQTVTVSVNTATARDKPAPKTKASISAAKGAPVPSDQLGLPPAAQSTLEEAEKLLSEAGEKLTRVDRAGLMKNVEHLRGVATRGAAEDEVELSRAALDKIVERVKKAKPPRRRV